MSYTPIPEDQLHDYGELPEVAGNTSVYQLSLSNIPSTAKEVLVYLWATTMGDEAFHRYYYRIYTSDGTQLYSQYMNVAASRDVSLNSANLWLPVFPGFGEVTVTLVDADQPSAKGKRISHRGQRKSQKEGENTFSEFFVLGYRN